MMIRSPKKRFSSALLTAVLLVTACSSGGGNSTGTVPGNNNQTPGILNTPPAANAGPDQAVIQGSTVQLAGSGSDADGTITSYRWTQVSGPSTGLSNSEITNPSFTAPDVSTPQALVYRLTVTDNAGSTAMDSVQIAVVPQSQPTPTPTPTPLPALSITSIELAQTHVLPPTGRSWTLTNTSGTQTASESLHLTGGRAALALIGLSANNVQSPQLEAVAGASSLGSMALNPPAMLPPTESNGAAYSSTLYSATIPATWVQPGVQFRVLSSNHTPSALSTAATVGGDFPMTLRVLPFYIFGANETNTSRPLLVTGAPSSTVRQEIFAKWPVATLDAANHPAGKVEWPYLILPPGTRGGVAEPARRATSINDYRDGFTGMGTVLGILGDLLRANGEAAQPVQYYAPLLAITPAGAYSGPGGGLGGGSVGTGDETYAGIFIHEQGHAFGLPHAGEAFDAFKYPYEWGSLNGSLWGYDPNRREFLAPFMPSNSSRASGCASATFGGHARARDSLNRCFKQDPMQSGAGDQAAGYQFATFSDYSTAVMQRWFEGTTTQSGSTHTYSGGKVVRDASFAGGYKRWDSLDQRWINVTPATTDGGIFGLDGGLPITRDVPVYAIAVTVSNANTPGITQIYPPIRFRGNLMRSFDPSNATDLAAITPDTSPTYYWYCRNGGCDYTLRVTYANLSKRTVLLQGGFRPFNQPSGAPAASATNPLDGNSFRRFVVNVPDDGNITSIELLSTPRAWLGMPSPDVVLATR